MSSFPIVVLCSGRGSNLQALIDAAAAGVLPITIRAVVSDKAQCAALDRARRAGIATVALHPHDFSDRAAFDRAVFDEVARFKPQLVVLAGYMRVIDEAIVATWRGRMINIHPSLLPKYPGLHTHQRALNAGDAQHGATVHYVTAELDGGPRIAQASLPVVAGDTAQTLAQRLLPLEHRLLVASVNLIASGRVSFEKDRAILDGQALAEPLQLGANGELRKN